LLTAQHPIPVAVAGVFFLFSPGVGPGVLHFFAYSLVAASMAVDDSPPVPWDN